MNCILRAPIALAVTFASVCGTAFAAVTPLGPTPYLGFNDSPFSGGSFSYFHLETFEDHLLNTPGVTASAGGVASVVFGPSIHDSVDADDGTLNGSGLGGDSFFTGNGSTGIMFTFSAAVLGALPTSAGLVWTDGGGGTSVTFSVFGSAGELVYTTTQNGFADNSNSGETAEDRFFGATSSGGISAIFMSNASGGMEVDHLQYGLAGPVTPSIPEPQTYALLLAGLVGVGCIARRRKADR